MKMLDNCPNKMQLIYWISERWQMKLQKDAGNPGPWSANPVMNETYFCNVNREDDKVTKWIRRNWKANDTNQRNYVLAMIVARLFNKPETLEVIGIPYGYNVGLEWCDLAHKILRQKQDRGDTIFNGAYIVSTNGKKMNKIDYIFMLLEQIADTDILSGSGLKLCKKAHQQLMEVEGLASFMAAQVVADLKNSPGHPLYNANDKRVFSAPGPGSLRGLAWFNGMDSVAAGQYHELIHEAMEFCEWELEDDILDILDHQNLQNCFCEYDKFMRVTHGTGRSKRKYRWDHK